MRKLFLIVFVVTLSTAARAHEPPHEPSMTLSCGAHNRVPQVVLSGAPSTLEGRSKSMPCSPGQVYEITPGDTSMPRRVN